MLAIIPFLVNFQALIQCLCDYLLQHFPSKISKGNQSKGNMQVIGSKEILSRKTNDE